MSRKLIESTLIQGQNEKFLNSVITSKITPEEDKSW